MAVRTLEDLIESFSLFDNWEDRYRYLIDLGGRLPPVPEDVKTDGNLVKGCTSRVWMSGGTKDGLLHFQADSDAQIVRGLIYVLLTAYQDKPVQDVLDLDIQKAFERMGLHQHLSPNRRNGFFAMVERIGALSRPAA